jgi:small subunit ribosomal protein S20
MPQHKSNEKRVRQTEKRRQRNLQKKTQIKSAIKKVRGASNKETAAAELKKTCVVLDRMASKGIIHKNKAANVKSKLSRFVNKLS